MDNEYILCAAIHYDDGHEYDFQPSNIGGTGFVICGHRHHNIIHFARQLLDMRTVGEYICQGFLTSVNRFVNREDALKIALANNQIITDSVSSDLVSEDLY